MNVMAEEEAKGKWCPFTFAAPEQRAADGAGIRMAGPWACSASACMSWRWWAAVHYRETELWSKAEGRRVNSAWEDDAEWRPVGAKKDADPPPPVGFCGLAGRPTP